MVDERYQLSPAGGILEEDVNLQCGLITVCGTQRFLFSLTIKCLSNVIISAMPEDSLSINERPFYPLHLSLQTTFLSRRIRYLKPYLLRHVQQAWT